MAARAHRTTLKLAEAIIATMENLQTETAETELAGTTRPCLWKFDYVAGVTAPRTERSSGLEISDRNGCLLAHIG